MPATETIDKPDNSKARVSSCTLGKSIPDISSGKDAIIVLSSGNDVKLHFAAVTERVDGDWVINEKANAPYRELVVVVLVPVR